jgi:transposase-like protein
MKQSKYSNEEKLKIIAEAKSSGNIAATAKKYSI